MPMDGRYLTRSQGWRCEYAYMDVGKGRELGAEALPMDVGKGRELGAEAYSWER